MSKANGISRRNFLGLLAAATSSSASLAQQPALRSGSTETVVLSGDVLSGTIDATPVLQDLIRSNRKVIVPPGATLLFDSFQHQRPPQFTKVRTCVIGDGVENFHLDGNGATVRFGDKATEVGHKWILFQTSTASKKQKLFTNHISISNFLIEGRTASNTEPNAWLTAIQLSSVEGCLVDNVRLTGQWDGSGRSSFIQGDNVRNSIIRNVSGHNLVTAFDVSSWDRVVLEDFRFSSDNPSSLAGLNLFYAPVARIVNLKEGNGFTPANVIIRNGSFKGFRNGLVIEGQRDTRIENVELVGGRAKREKEVPKGIYIYCSKRAQNVGRFTAGVSIDRCTIRDFRNEQNGHGAGIKIEGSEGYRIDDVRVTRSKIYNNTRYGIVCAGEVSGLVEEGNSYGGASKTKVQTEDVACKL